MKKIWGNICNWFALRSPILKKLNKLYKRKYLEQGEEHAAMEQSLRNVISVIVFKHGGTLKIENEFFEAMKGMNLKLETTLDEDKSLVITLMEEKGE